MKRRWLAAGAAPFLLAFALLWQRHLDAAAPDIQAPASPSAAVVGPRPQLATTDPHIEGAARTFAVHTRHVTVLEGGSGGSKEVALQLEGRIAWTTVRRTEAGTVQRAVLQPGGKVEIWTGDRPAGTPAELEKLLGALEEPFFVEHDAEGRVERFHFDPAVPTMARGLLRTVTTSLQVVRGQGDAWQSRERDSTGTYLASYRGESAGRMIKEKLRYERVSTAGKARPVALEVIESRSEMDVDAWSAPIAAVLRERLSVPAVGGAPGVSSRLELRATLVASGMDGDAVGTFEDRSGFLETLDVDAIDGAEAAKRRSDEALVGERSFDDIREELREGGEDSARVASAQVRLAALFRTDPDAALEAEAAVRAGKAGADTRAAVAALASAGTEEAQHALARVVEDPDVDPALRQQAIMNAGLVEQPDDRLASTLLAQSRGPAGPLQTSALLAVGSIASHVGPDQAAGWLDELVGRYRSAGTLRERILALDALGNTGSPSALATIGDAMQSADEALRAAAARALRRIPGLQSDRWLDALIGHDPSATVRSAALQACMSRDALVHAASGVKALTDADATVRLGAVLLLGRALAAGGQVRAPLAAVAGGDPSSEVRAAAQAIVGA